MIGVAVVGQGYAGSRIHVPLVQLEPRLSLVGICSGSAEKRAQIAARVGAAGAPLTAYATLDEVLADGRVDLVILATPNRLHAPQACAALRAGKHVVVDKPMCLSSGEAEAMLTAACAANRYLCVFHNRRFDGDFLTLQALTKELGTLRWLELSWQKPGLPRTWRREAAEGGGRLIDLGSHLIDQALLLTGSPVRNVYCRKHHEHPAHDIETHALLVLEHVNGATSVIDTTTATFDPKPRYRLLGERATFVKYGVDPQEAALASGDIDAARDPEHLWGRLCAASGSRCVPTAPGRWRDFYARVAVAIEARDPSLLPMQPEEAAAVVRALELAAESAATGGVSHCDR
jgi:predicted dehydrogenase